MYLVKVSCILLILKGFSSFLEVVKGVAQVVGDVAGAIRLLAGNGGNATMGGGLGAAAGFPVWASVAIAIGLLLLAVVVLVVGLCWWQQAL